MVRARIVPFERDWRALRDAVAKWCPDLIVLIARKAPRANEAARLDLERVAPVLSDLALPYVDEGVCGMRIAVVDDTINVGSTVAFVLKQLENLGVGETRAFALCARKMEASERAVDLDQITLVAEERVSDRMWRALASATPELIATLNKPYDLDFPILRARLTDVIGSGQDLLAELNTRYPGCVRDLSSGVNRSSDHHRFTVEVSASTDADRSAEDISKVRLYVDETTREVSVAPMLIAAPLPIEPSLGWPQIQQAWDGFLDALPERSRKDEVHARLALFLDSLRLGAHFLADASDLIEASPFEVVSRQDLNLGLGPLATCITDELVLSLVSDCEADHIKPFSAQAVLDEPMTSPAFEMVWPALRKEVMAESGDPYVRAVALFEGLGRLSGSQRITANQLSWPYTQEEFREDPRLRLQVGFSFGDFVRILHEGREPDGDWAQWVATASILIDRLIDVGAVVPIIARYPDDKCYRLYRKGEGRPREYAPDSVSRGLVEFGRGLPATRISKVAVIAALSGFMPSGSHVSTEERGNVLTRSGEMLEDPAEITQYMLRRRMLVRVPG
jgi:hypothetical protein